MNHMNQIISTLLMHIATSHLTAYKQTYQWRWRRECRPSLSVISAAFIALGRSCLFANTSNTASRSSSWSEEIVHQYVFFNNTTNEINSEVKLTSFSILWSSSRASTTRSLSLLSTTNMRPWVFWK